MKSVLVLAIASMAAAAPQWYGGYSGYGYPEYGYAAYSPIVVEAPRAGLLGGLVGGLGSALGGVVGALKTVDTEATQQ